MTIGRMLVVLLAFGGWLAHGQVVVAQATRANVASQCAPVPLNAVCPLPTANQPPLRPWGGANVGKAADGSITTRADAQNMNNGDFTNWLITRDFRLSLPVGRIVGLEVVARVSGASSVMMTVGLVVPSAPGGVVVAPVGGSAAFAYVGVPAAITTTPAPTTFGGPTSLWAFAGGDVSTIDVTSADFGVAFVGRNLVGGTDASFVWEVAVNVYVDTSTTTAPVAPPPTTTAAAAGGTTAGGSGTTSAGGGGTTSAAGSGPPIGAIAGGVVGGVLLIAGIIVLALVLSRRERTSTPVYQPLMRSSAGPGAYTMSLESDAASHTTEPEPSAHNTTDILGPSFKL